MLYEVIHYKSTIKGDFNNCKFCEVPRTLLCMRRFESLMGRSILSKLLLLENWNKADLVI